MAEAEIPDQALVLSIVAGAPLPLDRFQLRDWRAFVKLWTNDA
jgi:hypothetical protein